MKVNFMFYKIINIFIHICKVTNKLVNHTALFSDMSLKYKVAYHRNTEV